MRVQRLSQKEERNKRQARTKCLSSTKPYSAVPHSPGRPLLSKSHAVDGAGGERAVPRPTHYGGNIQQTCHPSWRADAQCKNAHIHSNSQHVFTEEGLPFTRVNMHVYKREKGARDRERKRERGRARAIESDDS